MTDAGRAMDDGEFDPILERMDPSEIADTIHALRSERDRLQSIVASYRGSYAKEQAIAADAEQRAEKAEAEAEANRRDAERYRKVRNLMRIGPHGELVVMVPASISCSCGTP